MTASRAAPLYRQVAARILAELEQHPRPDRRLPSERDLCRQFGVSRVTLRTALGLLADDGIVAPSAARGWFVTGPRTRSGDVPPPATAPGVAGFTEMAVGRGQQTSSTVLEATTRPSTLDEAEEFSIVPGAEVFELRRLRRIEDLVIAVDRSRVPVSLCPGVADHDYATESLYAVLRAQPDPVEPTVADYAVEAAQAESGEADLLGLPPGVPLLVARQRTRDQHGRVFELGQTSYRGDRYRFRATLRAVS